MSGRVAAVEGWRTCRDLFDLLYRMRICEVGCSFATEAEPDLWHDVLEDPRRSQLITFELRYGFEKARADPNADAIAKVRRTGRTQLVYRGEHADLFVPVASGGVLKGVLAAGPMLVERPTARALREKWRVLTGHRGSTEGGAFLQFVRGTLDGLVFEGPALGALQRWFECLAEVVAGRGLPSDSVECERVLRRACPEAGMWHVADKMVDRDTSPSWMAAFRRGHRLTEGLTRRPDSVIAVAPVFPPTEPFDVVEHMLRLDALQRACAACARSLPETLAGRVGEQGAFVLTHVGPNKSDRARAQLLRLAERVGDHVRRRLGVRVACGIGQRAAHGGELPQRYDEAVWALSWALHRGERVTFYEQSAEPGEAGTAFNLYRSARALRESYAYRSRKETELCAQQVIQDVLWVSAGSIEAMRSHFVELLWELVTVAERRKALDSRVLKEVVSRCTARVQDARTARHATAAFAELVTELCEATEKPALAGRKAKLDAARRIVQQGHGGQIDLGSVAKRIGLSVPYLSREFKRAYGVGFRAYVRTVKVERSKELLRGTDLPMPQVSEEAGFSSRAYFYQAFKRTVHTTPERYRRETRATS